MSRSKRNKRPAARPTKTPDQLGYKPRVMVAGEFSAGKTRLITGLLGEDVLPSNVTATALPPVWLIEGERRFAVVDLDGNMHEVDTLTDIDVANTHFCLVSHPAEILKKIDIIDTPGSSDPNIPAESWERMLAFADHAIWCTNATQAWRQSEKSVWSEIPDHLAGHATLLVTHADRLTDETMSNRVMRRVKREAKDYFAHFMMAALIKEADIAKVAAHISDLVANIIVKAGAPCAERDKFANDWTPEPAQTTARKVKPKRVRLVNPGAEQTTDLAGDSSKIHVLGPRLPKEKPEARDYRALWNSVSDGADTKDAAAILDCVDKFILLLEGADPDAISPAHLADDSTADQITSIVNGRKV